MAGFQLVTRVPGKLEGELGDSVQYVFFGAMFLKKKFFPEDSVGIGPGYPGTVAINCTVLATRVPLGYVGYGFLGPGVKQAARLGVCERLVVVWVRFWV